MAPVTIVFGLLLIAVGLGGYFGGGQVSPTALIPACIGLLLLVLGLLARRDALRKHAMHGAAMVGLLGMLGSLYRPVRALASGSEITNTLAFASQLVTAALCACFVGLCVRSFIQARRRRAASEGGGSAA